MRKFLYPLIVSCFIGIAMISSPVYSQVEAHIRIAPPRAVVEVRGPRPSAGAVWVGGFHEYDQPSNAYAWRPGRWEENPPAGRHRWTPTSYKRSHGEYKRVEGRWR